VDVDGSLIEDRNKEQSQDEIVEMMNGCICCTVRADLQVLLKKLLITQKRELHAIIIETTGLADPAPVAQTFFVDEELQGLCYLDAIITMVDAAHIDQQLSRDRPEGVENEAEEQLAFADKIVRLQAAPSRTRGATYPLHGFTPAPPSSPPPTPLSFCRSSTSWTWCPTAQRWRPQRRACARTTPTRRSLKPLTRTWRRSASWGWTPSTSRA
jgi:hypothetical protein